MEKSRDQKKIELELDRIINACKHITKITNEANRLMVLRNSFKRPYFTHILTLTIAFALLTFAIVDKSILLLFVSAVIYIYCFAFYYIAIRRINRIDNKIDALDKQLLKPNVE